MPRPISPTPIRPISSKTIECNPVELAMWLNDLADLVNYTNKLSVDNYNVNQDLLVRVECIENDIVNIKQDIVEINNEITNLDSRVDWLETQFSSVNGIFNELLSRLDWIYNHLPFALGNEPANWTFAGGNKTLIHTDIADAGDIYQIVNLVDDKVNWYDARLPRAKGSLPSDFKMAFGNINVMSANGGTPSLNIGIFTSGAVENDDLYFN